MCPSYPCFVNGKSPAFKSTATYGERPLIMDGPSENEVRLYAALSVSVLALELIADETLDNPRSAAATALEHLRERYAVDLPRP
jgi:hypothetical protein